MAPQYKKRHQNLEEAAVRALVEKASNRVDDFEKTVKKIIKLLEKKALEWETTSNKDAFTDDILHIARYLRVVVSLHHNLFESGVCDMLSMEVGLVDDMVTRSRHMHLILGTRDRSTKVLKEHIKFIKCQPQDWLQKLHDNFGKKIVDALELELHSAEFLKYAVFAHFDVMKFEFDEILDKVDALSSRVKKVLADTNQVFDDLFGNEKLSFKQYIVYDHKSSKPEMYAYNRHLWPRFHNNKRAWGFRTTKGIYLEFETWDADGYLSFKNEFNNMESQSELIDANQNDDTHPEEQQFLQNSPDYFSAAPSRKRSLSENIPQPTTSTTEQPGASVAAIAKPEECEKERDNNDASNKEHAKPRKRTIPHSYNTDIDHASKKHKVEYHVDPKRNLFVDEEEDDDCGNASIVSKNLIENDDHNETAERYFDFVTPRRSLVAKSSKSSKAKQKEAELLSLPAIIQMGDRLVQYANDVTKLEDELVTEQYHQVLLAYDSENVPDLSLFDFFVYSVRYAEKEARVLPTVRALKETSEKVNTKLRGDDTKEPFDDTEESKLTQKKDIVNTKFSIMKAASMIATKFINQITQSLFVDILTELSDAVESCDRRAVSSTLDLIEKALVEDKALLSIQSHRDGSHGEFIKIQTTEINDAGESIVGCFKVVEFGELIFYCRNLNLLDCAAPRLFMRISRSHDMTKESEILGILHSFLRLYLCFKIEGFMEGTGPRELHAFGFGKIKNRLEAVKSNWNRIITLFAHGNKKEKQSISDKGGNSAAASSRKGQPVLTKSSDGGNSGSNKALTTPSASTVSGLTMSMDDEKSKSSERQVSRSLFLTEEISMMKPNSNNEHQTSSSDVSTMILRNLLKYFTNRKTNCGASEDNCIHLMAASFLNINYSLMELLNHFLSAVHNDTCPSGKDEWTLFLHSWCFNRVMINQTLFWMYLPFSPDSCLFRPSNKTLSWLLCAFMLKHRSDCIAEYMVGLSPTTADDVQSQIETFLQHYKLPEEPQMDDLKAIIDVEINRLDTLLSSNRESASTTLTRSYKLRLELLAQLKRAKNILSKSSHDEGGVNEDDFPLEAMHFLFEGSNFQVMTFTHEIALGPFIATESRMLFCGSNLCLDQEQALADTQSFESFRSIIINMLNNAVVYSPDYGFMIPHLPVPTILLNQLKQAMEGVARAVASGFYATLFHNNLLDQSKFAYWIPSVLSQLSLAVNNSSVEFPQNSQFRELELSQLDIMAQTGTSSAGPNTAAAGGDMIEQQEPIKVEFDDPTIKRDLTFLMKEMNCPVNDVVKYAVSLLLRDRLKNIDVVTPSIDKAH